MIPRDELDAPLDVLLRRHWPSYGPGWDAAIAAGIDVSQIEENLALSPAERLRRHQDMTELWASLQPRS